MKEIDFYPEICSKFKTYLEHYLPKNTQIAYAYNKTLPQLITDLERQLLPPKSINNQYISDLKLDIAIGLKQFGKNEIDVLLLEVKFANQLTLANFSQLSGYLQVAKFISIGILLLVDKNPNTANLSNDFAEIVTMNELPMNWEMMVKNSNQSFEFKTGIAVYVPNNGIDWVNTKTLNGICSFEDLVNHLNS
jgi:hypothetical protein